MRITDQHLQDVVQNVSGTGTAFCEVIFGQYTESFAVHLEQIYVELGKVELSFAEAQEYSDLIATPNSRVGVQLWWKLCLEVSQRTGRCRRIPP